MVDPGTLAQGRGRVEIEEETPVAGTVRLMTDEPIPVKSLDPASPLSERLQEIASRRPWVFPAVLLAGAALYLLLRSR